MSRWISTNQELMTLYKVLSGHDPNTDCAQVIFEFHDGAPVAAMCFDFFNGASIHVHMWRSKYGRPSRIWWWAVHDYVFNQLCAKQAIGIVAVNRRETVRFAKRMGGKQVAVLPDYCLEGDAAVFAFTAESARHWQHYRSGTKPAPTYVRNLARA